MTDGQSQSLKTARRRATRDYGAVNQTEITYKVHPNRADVRLLEGIILRWPEKRVCALRNRQTDEQREGTHRKSEKERALSDTRITNDDQLEQVVVVSLAASHSAAKQKAGRFKQAAGFRETNQGPIHHTLRYIGY